VVAVRRKVTDSVNQFSEIGLDPTVTLVANSAFIVRSWADRSWMLSANKRCGGHGDGAAIIQKIAPHLIDLMHEKLAES
jgi:hypothetical protein